MFKNSLIKLDKSFMVVPVNLELALRVDENVFGKVGVALLQVHKIKSGLIGLGVKLINHTNIATKANNIKLT